jgi:hypothetical protein
MIIHIITYGDKVRKDIIKKQLKKCDVEYKFHSFEKHSTNETLGRYTNHVELFQYADRHDMEYICVAEDNINVAYHLTSKIKKEIDSFLQTPDWNVLYLGGLLPLVCSYKDTSFSSIFQTNSNHGASCYIIHKRLYRTLLQSVVKKDISECLYQPNTLQNFILYPILFHISPTCTNDKSFVHSLSTRCSSLLQNPSVVKTHEWFIRYGWLSWPVVISIILILLLLIYWLCKIV